MPNGEITFADLNASDFRALDYAFPGDELFDGEYYFATNIIPDDMNPFTDYVENGYQAGRNPNGLFDVDYYLNTNTDVKNNGMDPLKHFALYGYTENFDSRDPNPLFDSSYYNAKNPDVVAEGMNPLLHYMQFGWKESRINNPGGFNPNRDPNAFFDTSFYFDKHNDVLNASYFYDSANPVQHYLEFGNFGLYANENRPTHQTQQYDKVAKITRRFTPDSDSQELLDLKNDLLDNGYNLTINDDKSFEIAQATSYDDLWKPVFEGLKGLALGVISYSVYHGVRISNELTQVVFDGFDDVGKAVSFSGYTGIPLESLSTDAVTIDHGDPSLSDLLGTRPFPGQTESQRVVEIFTTPDIDGLEDFTIFPDDSGIFLPTTTEFPQRDETLEAILNGGLFLGGEETPQGAYFYAAGEVTVIGNPDFPGELPQAIRLGQLEGGGTIRFLGGNSQGIEGYFTPSGETEEKPFSLKASNDVGRKANLIQIINRNGVQIQRAGITDPVLLRIESKQFGAEELKNFIEGGIIEKIPTEGIFERIYFDAADGTVVVDSTGTSITK